MPCVPIATITVGRSLSMTATLPNRPSNGKSQTWSLCRRIRRRCSPENSNAVVQPCPESTSTR